MNGSQPQAHTAGCNFVKIFAAPEAAKFVTDLQPAVSGAVVSVADPERDEVREEECDEQRRLRCGRT